MITVGRAYAIIRGRMAGDVEKAKSLLDTTPAAESRERNRQDSKTQVRRSKKPYRLGEKIRIRNG